MIYYIFYSGTLILFWGLLFLDNNEAGLVGVFIGLVYTFYSSFFINDFVRKETSLLKVIKVSGPVLYVVSNLIFNKINYLSLIHPINIAFLVFMVSLFIKSKFPSKALQFFMISLIYLYSFTIYEKWENNRDDNYSPYNFNSKNLNNNNNNNNNNDTIPLSLLNSFIFLDSNLDTVSIATDDKYTIIETWNERCVPCLMAIPGMNKFYHSLEDYSNQYYIYKAKNSYSNLDYNKVFSFDKINDKDKILIDIDMYDKLYINGYPYFLVFNKNGKLIFKQIGYNENMKIELQDTIQKLCKFQ